MLTPNVGNFLRSARENASLADNVQRLDCYRALAELTGQAGEPLSPSELRTAFAARSAKVLAPQMMRHGLIDKAPIPPVPPLDEAVWDRASTVDLGRVVAQLVNYQDWSVERAAAAERRYRRFLYLKTVLPEGHASPTPDVDLFWHQHIINTLHYGSDCEFVAGRFMHHTFEDPHGPDGHGRLSAIWVATWVWYETLFEEPFQETIGAALLRRWPQA